MRRVCQAIDHRNHRLSMLVPFAEQLDFNFMLNSNFHFILTFFLLTLCTFFIYIFIASRQRVAIKRK